jgi:hypothetical protein
MPQLIETGVAYLALKAAQKLYSKATAALQPEEFERVQGVAQQQYSLETRVLAAPEARDVMVPPATVEAAMQEIRGRYQSEEEFTGDLARNGLDEISLATSLEREMKVEAIMEKVGTRAESVSDMDVELFYQYHPEQFLSPLTKPLPKTRAVLRTSASLPSPRG